ncbi:hypothetical protein TNCV_2428301 [Trichonephila clavipes]|nr:hypothetical protein TNCV_2428301 [Trichonephila clavipes]
MKHLEDLDEKEGKVSLQSYRFMSNWTEKFRNNPYLRKLVTNLIQKVCDKEISSEESLNLVSEMMFLQNVRILQAASYQCEFTSSRMMCIQHFPFKFERIWSQEPQGSIKYQKNVLENVCEIFITKLIESETRLAHQYDFCIASKCLNFFKEDLSLRLTLVFSRYKARMFKEMKYNFKKYHKITMGEGLENPNTFFKNFMENPPKVKDEKVLDYPRSTDYFKCDYSLALYPDEELGGSEKSGGNDEEESSDDENFRYVEALSDGEGPCTPASYLRRQKRKYFRFLGEIPKYCLDHKNLISSYRKKAKDEKPCTGSLSVFV